MIIIDIKILRFKIIFKVCRLPVGKFWLRKFVNVPEWIEIPLGVRARENDKDRDISQIEENESGNRMSHPTEKPELLSFSQIRQFYAPVVLLFVLGIQNKWNFYDLQKVFFKNAINFKNRVEISSINNSMIINFMEPKIHLKKNKNFWFLFSLTK